MKGKFFLSIFALLLPVTFVGQVAKPIAPAADAPSPLQRYGIFADFAYSSANQVKGSSSLIGFNVGVDAKFKKWVGGTAEFGQYSLGTGMVKPTVTTYLAVPEFYIPSDRLTGILHVTFGGAHTGGVVSIPDVSFAYGIGGGLEYKVANHWSARLMGDGISSSFVLAPATSGYSAHARWNPRATFGVSYHF